MPSRLQVLTPEHEKVALDALWSASPVLLVFVRHFG